MFILDHRADSRTPWSILLFASVVLAGAYGIWEHGHKQLTLAEAAVAQNSLFLIAILIGIRLRLSYATPFLMALPLLLLRGVIFYSKGIPLCFDRNPAFARAPVVSVCVEPVVFQIALLFSVIGIMGIGVIIVFFAKSRLSGTFRTALRLFNAWRSVSTSLAYMYFLMLSILAFVAMLAWGLVIVVGPVKIGSSFPIVASVCTFIYGFCYFVAILLTPVLALAFLGAKYVGLFVGNVGPLALSLVAWLWMDYVGPFSIKEISGPYVIVLTLCYQMLAVGLSLRWFEQQSYLLPSRHAK